MKTLSKLFAVILALAVLSVGAFAGQIKLSQGALSSGNGGAFYVTNITGVDPIDNTDYSLLAQVPGGGFLTFCVEENEYFTPGATYNYTLSNGAKKGGIAGQTSPGYDGLSNASAWLYSNFAKGTLSDFTPFAYTKPNMALVQTAIWHLETEGPAANSLATLAKTTVGASWALDNNGALGVQVLNLTSMSGGVAQDQLYYSSPVKDSSVTLMLMSLGFMGLVGFRKFS